MKKLSLGFTLVELLVVIAIIAILAGMLLHARPNGSADVWYFDSHVESMTKNRLEPFGIKALVGPDTIPGYFWPQYEIAESFH